ncbi:MAG: hypothetical protein ACI8RD_014142 [Bacillariaceae sp.]|jgi:hypothetical protein
MKSFTFLKTATATTTIMFSIATRRAAGFVNRNVVSKTATRSFGGNSIMNAKEGQAEVILVGCGAPNRGMGWYHAIQMLEEK